MRVRFTLSTLLSYKFNNSHLWNILVWKLQRELKRKEQFHRVWPACSYQQKSGNKNNLFVWMEWASFSCMIHQIPEPVILGEYKCDDCVYYFCCFWKAKQTYAYNVLFLNCGSHLPFTVTHFKLLPSKPVFHTVHRCRERLACFFLTSSLPVSK